MLELLRPWAAANPGWFFLLMLGVLLAGVYLLGWPFRLVNRWIRHRNIVTAGWPPAHLDADGDVYREAREEDDDAG